MRWGVVALLGLALSGLVAALSPGATASVAGGGPGGGGISPFSSPAELTIAQMQRMLSTHQITSVGLTEMYLARIQAIDQNGPKLKSIIQINPDALAIAAARDRERALRGPRSRLDGIPVVIKANIDTADRMDTTAGSLALVGAPRPRQDAFVAQRLRQAGAVILAKTNLSEWANFRSTRSASGWSGQGGQNRMAYVLDRDPCGSSSGSAVAVSANLAAAGLGTETDGSITCPASVNSVVGIKPTLGLTSRAGVIPIAHSQDVVGPFGRTVADAAAVLSVMTGVDRRDPATRASAGRFPREYTRYLDRNGLRGARIGIVRESFMGYSGKADLVADAAFRVLRRQGAVLVDPANLPKNAASPPDELTVLEYEFKADLTKYLAARGGRMHTLQDLIRFDRTHRPQELRYFNQDLFLQSQAKGPLTSPDYQKALANDQRYTRQEGIDAVLTKDHLDALVTLSFPPAWPIDLINGDHFLGGSSTPAAVAGYPDISVPAGYTFGLPIGISFFGRPYSEPKLIRYAYAFEQASKARRPPQFLPTLPLP